MSAELLDDFGILTDPATVYSEFLILYERHRANLKASRLQADLAQVDAGELALACGKHGLFAARFRDALEVLIYSGLLLSDPPYLTPTLHEKESIEGGAYAD